MAPGYRIRGLTFGHDKLAGDAAQLSADTVLPQCMEADATMPEAAAPNTPPMLQCRGHAGWDNTAHFYLLISFGFDLLPVCSGCP